MKKAIVVLVMLGIFVVAGPFVSGKLLEQRYQELLVEEAFEDVFLLHGKGYERDWMSSTIVTEFEVTDEKFAAEYKRYKNKANASAGIKSDETRPVFKVESIVHHGPFWLGESFGIGLGKVESRLILDDETRTKTAGMFEGELLSMQVMVHFSRSADVILNTSKILFNDKQTEEMAIVHPVLSHWHIAKLGHQAKGEITWEGLTFTGKEGVVNLSETTIKTDVEHYQGVWVGNVVWDQKKVLFEGQGKKLMIKNLHLDSDTHIGTRDDLVDTVINSTVESVDVAGEMYGPGVYRMSMENLPVDTLAKIQQLESKAASHAAQSVNMQDLMTLLPEMLSHGPVLEISEMEVSTPHGNVQGTLKTTLPETAPEQFADIQHLKKSVLIDADLTVPAVYFADSKMAPVADNLTLNGFIEAKDGMLHSTLHMADGKLSINGKPVPLPF